MKEESEPLRIKEIEVSDYECLLFGGTDQISLRWVPAKGKEPNFFWRFMQYICFGNKWRKIK